MTITINSGKKAKSLAEAIDKLKEKPSSKAFDAYKYLGKLKKGVDAIDYQQMARDEWN
ncbi:hypothetical protein [Persicitalea jodogahamensis]|uniref:Uncharacterized protein n=1 Tax=Persicitalea jodogahamensis TaxID=402147 RepID=A0A8J3D6W8_9BACT|nr:hypothetical protein [Persicitalea jodogahamensis]GHB82870.1 hypothetical protein GCM10007390_42200 [Persicitalea jodogahamensis]